MPDSLSRQLARWAVNLDAADLPPAVVDKMQTSLLHATVVAIIGAETHHGKAAVDLALAEEASAHGASILASGGRATRCGAAFANSKLMHATNQADSYRMLTHPGPCVIPAALASAQLGGATGAQLITAMAAAYEVESRIAGDFIASTQARGFRSSPIYGTLGAAVATGKLLGLTEDQMVTAIALACTFTAGTNEGPRSGGREMMFHEPQSTRSGIMAALLAREDVRGSEEALEGPAGFYNAFTGNNRGELSYVFTGPQQVSFEPVTEGPGNSLGTAPHRAQDVPHGRLQLPRDRPDDGHPALPPAGHRRDRAHHHRPELAGDPLPVAGLPQSVARSGRCGQHPLLRRLRRRERELSAAAHPHRSW